MISFCQEIKKYNIDSEQLSVMTDQFFLSRDPVNTSQNFLDHNPMLISYSQMFPSIFIACTKNGDCKKVNNFLNSFNFVTGEWQ